MSTADGEESVISRILDSMIRYFPFLEKYYRIALASAVNINDLEVVKLLMLHHGSEVSRRSYCEFINIAIKNDNIEIVKLLSVNAADVNCRENDDPTPLVLAVNKGNFEIVRLLIEKGANVNFRNINDNVPLGLAALKGQLEIVRLLIYKGADINSRNKCGYSPLDLAASNGHLETVRLLIDKGVDVNSRNNSNNTSLEVAACNGHLETVRFLIDKGAYVNSTNNFNITPLGVAAFNGHLEIVRLLIDKGADINSREQLNITILGMAIESGNLEMIKLLIDKGSYVNPRNSTYQPLFLAVRHRRFDIVKLLLDHRADVKFTDKDKCFEVLCMVARAEAGFKIAELFFNYGADANFFLTVALEPPAEYFSTSWIKFLTQHTLVQNPNAKKPKFACYKKWSRYWDKCKAQINTMGKQKIGCSTITFYMFIVSGEQKLANWVSNEHVRQEINDGDYERKFPIYASIIKNQYQKGINRKALLDAGVEIVARFQSLSEAKLPGANVFLGILQYLENHDLQNLKAAARISPDHFTHSST